MTIATFENVVRFSVKQRRIRRSSGKSPNRENDSESQATSKAQTKMSSLQIQYTDQVGRHASLKRSDLNMKASVLDTQTNEAASKDNSIFRSVLVD